MGAEFWAKTGDAYVWASGPWTPLSRGQWVDVPLMFDLPSRDTAGEAFDPSQVRELGVQIACGTKGDASSYVGGQFCVDVITIEPIE